MLKLSEQDAQTLRSAVALARSREGLTGTIRTLHADLQQQIDLRKPRCDASGRCCRFEEYGHRLFITTLELAAFVEELSSQSDRRSEIGIRQSLGCPFQLDRLCSVHTIRPFGCRIYFCDPTAQEWQHEQYEAFHLRIRQLHTELDVPYLYVEWREALRAVIGSP